MPILAVALHGKECLQLFLRHILLHCPVSPPPLLTYLSDGVGDLSTMAGGDVIASEGFPQGRSAPKPLQLAGHQGGETTTKELARRLHVRRTCAAFL